jgi:drug/metabolite transporter (DMT)-like permease
MNKFFAGPGLILLAAFLWALDGILRRSLYSLPPITIVFYEHLIGLLILLPFFLYTSRGEKLTKREWGAIFLVGTLSSVLGTLWFTTALLKTGFIAFSVVFLLQKLQPVFTMATAAIVLKEKITKDYIAWAGLALVSAYFVTFPLGKVNLTTGRDGLIAALFAVGAAIAWGSTTAFSRYALLKHSPTYIAGLRFMIAAVFALILAFFLPGTLPTFNAIQAADLWRLLAIALSTGMVALWIYYQGLKQTEAKVATILELIFPMTAVFIDIFLYHTVLHWSQYLAAIVLIYAVSRVSKLNKAGAAAEKLAAGI